MLRQSISPASSLSAPLTSEARTFWLSGTRWLSDTLSQLPWLLFPAITPVSSTVVRPAQVIA